MIRNRSVFALLGIALIAAACGGDAETADPPADGPEAAGGAEAVVASSGPQEACFLAGGTLAEATEKQSPLMAIHLSGDAGVLCWGAPSANGRTVMGELVPFDLPWRMGANEATSLYLTSATTVGGIALEPGSYSMFAIPSADSWEIFINSNAERWGIPIDDDVRAADMGSFSVNPEAASGMVETLTYSTAGGVITMEWENTRLSIPMGM